MITPTFGLTATERVLPKLALDFTTAALDSRITFTRTTGASNPATYTNSSGVITAATNNQPRFDYDPLTLACKGLLIEESRTNLMTYSADFGNAAWTPTNCTVTTDTATAPDGTVSGDSLIVSALSSNQGISSSSFTADGTSSYTGSIYVRKTGNVTGTLYFRPGLVTGNTYSQVVFNSGTGFVSFDLQSATSGSYTVTDVGGWWRITLTAGGIPAGAMQLHIRLVNRPVSTTLQIWGAQVEAGAFPTSYIPTTTTALTRNADVATMTGTNFSDWFNASEGGAVIQVLPSTTNGTRPAVVFDDNTTNEAIVLRGVASDPQLYVVDGGAAQATLDAGTITTNATYRLGGAWKASSFATAINGAASVSQSSGTYPTVTQARLGSDGTNYLNGWLQNLRYWSQRVINAEIQAFSK